MTDTARQVLPLEPLDAERFRPFGDVIEVSQRATNYTINEGWAQRFHDLARIDTGREIRGVVPLLIGRCSLGLEVVEVVELATQGAVTEHQIPGRGGGIVVQLHDAAVATAAAGKPAAQPRRIVGKLRAQYCAAGLDERAVVDHRPLATRRDGVARRWSGGRCDRHGRSICLCPGLLGRDHPIDAGDASGCVGPGDRNRSTRGLPGYRHIGKFCPITEPSVCLKQARPPDHQGQAARENGKGSNPAGRWFQRHLSRLGR